MIYKVEFDSGTTKSELEACRTDKRIFIHVAQGYELKGNMKFTTFINFSLDERDCEELIKALKLSLADLIEIKNKGIVPLR